MCTSPLFRFSAFSNNVLEPLIGKNRFKWNKNKRNFSVVFGRSDFELVQDRFPLLAERIQEIPCGNCIECRLDYSRVWAERAVLESRQHDKACFVTLTIDDDHLVYQDTLPPAFSYDPEKVFALQVVPMMTLVKKDLQDFMKRLRKSLPDVKIRFLACGEYGEESSRPHYHLIIFGYDFPDRIFFKSANGYNIYISPSLRKLWTLGNSSVCNFSFETAAYVARYCMKKIRGRSLQSYEESCYNVGVEPLQQEFLLSSRKPGLAGDFYRSVDLSSDPSFVLPQGRKATHNRYSDSFLSEDDLTQLKEARSRARTEREEFEFTQHSAPEPEVLRSRAIVAEHTRQRLQQKF